MAMWNLRFGVTGIRKKEFVAFQPVDEDCLSIKRLFQSAYFWQKKEEGEDEKEKYSTEAFL